MSRIIFEGFRTTERTRDMLLQARVIFYKKTGHLPPRVSQGSYNKGAVSASGGTHDRESLDFATSGWSAYLQKEWEKALWQVGFAAWWRRFIPGLWPEHCHAVPKGGDLSYSAQQQVYSFNHKRDGLRSNRSYSRIGNDAYATWDKYKKSHTLKDTFTINGKKVPGVSSVSVYWIKNAKAKNIMSRHVWIVQVWLKRLSFYKGKCDGLWNADTQLALDNFRKSLGWSAKDSVGPIGFNSLQWLRLKAKSTRFIREGK